MAFEWPPVVEVTTQNHVVVTGIEHLPRPVHDQPVPCVRMGAVRRQPVGPAVEVQRPVPDASCPRRHDERPVLNDAVAAGSEQLPAGNL